MFFFISVSDDKTVCKPLHMSSAGSECVASLLGDFEFDNADSVATPGHCVTRAYWMEWRDAPSDLDLVCFLQSGYATR